MTGGDWIVSVCVVVLSALVLALAVVAVLT